MTSDKAIRILCTGDLHLGRFPARVPAGDRTLSVETVWNALVDHAVVQDVDVLVLTGDVVDKDNAFYESVGPLKRGLRQLAAHDIPTYAVAGNHDHDVLPQVVDALDTNALHLLGRGGRWDVSPYPQDGEPVLHFAGWSFPRVHAPSSPLQDAPQEKIQQLARDTPVIGILHGDLDQAGSRYAPLARQELDALPAASWLLGHIHKPSRLPYRDGCILYPGSPQPLDPGEEGAHGPWLMEVAPDGCVEACQEPLATLRYQTLEVDLSQAVEESDFRRIVVQRIEEDLQALHGDVPSLRHVAYRLRLVGRTPLHRMLEGQIASIRADLDIDVEEVQATVDRVILATRPALDLEALTRGGNPPAVLARLLLELEEGAAPTEEHRALFRRLGEALEDVYRARAYDPLRQDMITAGTPTTDDMRRLLQRQGYLLLDEMRAQKPTSFE